MRVGLAILLVLAVAGCGGNTSVYFCSGSDEFCSRYRDHDDPKEEETQPAAADQALELARKTPRLVDENLAADGLRELSRVEPDTVGGWLLLSSLGVLADGSDNASASAFLDRARYWLVMEPAFAGDSPVLVAGLELLATVAAQRDPWLAQAALAHAAGAELPAPAAEVVSVEAAGAKLQALLAERADAPCCSATEQAAASVVLCGELTPPPESPPARGCAVAGAWLAERLEAGL